MDYQGFYNITPTVELKTAIWTRGRPMPVYETLVERTAPDGSAPDFAAIEAAKDKMIREGTSPDCFSTEGLANQINAQPNANNVSIMFVACYKAGEQTRRLY